MLEGGKHLVWWDLGFGQDYGTKRGRLFPDGHCKSHNLRVWGYCIFQTLRFPEQLHGANVCLSVSGGQKGLPSGLRVRLWLGTPGLISCSLKQALLWQNGQRLQRGLKSGKRRLRVEGPSVLREAPHPPKARRSLLGTFSACDDEPPNPAVDTWVLQTLGLKDLNTIDESPSANGSALTADLRLGAFLPGPLGPPDFGAISGPPAAHGCGALAPRDSLAIGREDPWPCAPQPLPLCGSSSAPQSWGPLAPGALPCCPTDSAPAQMDVAFTTSLSPHCNVKTHTFRQGQAFVRRGEDGGWKLTWVPKQPE